MRRLPKSLLRVPPTRGKARAIPDGSSDGAACVICAPASGGKKRDDEIPIGPVGGILAVVVLRNGCWAKRVGTKKVVASTDA